MRSTENQSPVTPPIAQALEAAGWSIISTNIRQKADSKVDSMHEIVVEKEGVRLDLVSHIREYDDFNGFLGYVVNNLDDDDDTFNELEAMTTVSHEGALLSIIAKLP